MKRTLSHPVFLICLILAMTNQLLEKLFGIFISLVNSYLDDLLCFPIVLTLGLAMYRFFKSEYQLTPWHIWPVTLVYSAYFEWYLPQTSTVYTADPVDVLMYFLGALMFQQFINRSRTNFRFAGFQNV